MRNSLTALCRVRNSIWSSIKLSSGQGFFCHTWTVCCILGFLQWKTLKLSGSFGITSTSIRFPHCNKERQHCELWSNFREIQSQHIAVCSLTYQYVSFVCKHFIPLFRDQQQLVKEKQRALIFGSLNAERSLQNQLPITGKIGSFPVGEQALYLLQQIKEEQPEFMSEVLLK